MKTAMTFALLILMIGCKKKEDKPETTNNTQNVCETKTKVFEGKYETQNNSKDTITIVFIHNNCPTEGVNTYSVYGLGKAYNNGISNSNLDVNKVYEITSNESGKSATTTGVNCKWGLSTVLTTNYTGIGSLAFKKI